METAGHGGRDWQKIQLGKEDRERFIWRGILGRDLQTGERVTIKMENVDARHPWQGVSYDENPENICQKKITTSIESLCNSHPREFASYFRYCLSLRFQQMPDYAYLKSLFHDLFVRKGFQYDNMFDWTILAEQKKVAQLSSRVVPRLLVPPSAIDSKDDHGIVNMQEREKVL